MLGRNTVNYGVGCSAPGTPACLHIVRERTHCRLARGPRERDAMGEKEPTPGKPSKEQRMNAGHGTSGGMLAPGASRGSDEGDSEDAARLSTNMTIERQTPKRDFGD